MLSSRFLINAKNLVFAPAAHKNLVRFLKSIFCSQTKNSLLRQQAAIANSQGLLPESLIWNYVIQLTSALRFALMKIVIIGMLMMIVRMSIIWNYVIQLTSALRFALITIVIMGMLMMIVRMRMIIIWY